MQEIRKYILSLVAAALICSIVKILIDNNTTHGKIIFLICGIFLTITVITPLVDIQIPSFELFTNSFIAEAEGASSYGKGIADNEYRSIIKSTTESYILEKASSMNATIEVDILLDEIDAVPKFISISGDVSPYVKQNLSNYLKDIFAIPEEHQKWNEIS